MGAGDYFLIDTTPITSNSTSKITKNNAIGSILVNPMTTLGDTLYENSTPTVARLAGNTTSTKKFLTQTGTGSVSAVPVWDIINAGDVPTLNQSTSGNAATATTATVANGLKSVSTTVSVSSATAPGAGQVLTATNSTTATWQNSAAGFSNPMTTSGDIIYGGASGVATRLAKGSNGQVLTLAAGIPSWVASSAGTNTFINVKSFGAIGDGSHDDTASINSAIASIPANGATLYFPAGTYKITSTLINMPSYTTLLGDGRQASRIFKNSGFGFAVTFNGSGGPGDNPYVRGGMENISIEGNATTGGLVQTNSAQQMIFRGCAFDGSNDVAMDLHTMQDSYFIDCTWNSNLSTTLPVINIYGDANGTSNMIWFAQCRVESFKAGAVWMKRGAGATGGGNNGFFFSQCKFESTTVRGDIIVADSYTQQLNMSQIFLSAGGFDSGFSTPVNGITFGTGGTSPGDNQASFRDVFINAGGSVGAAAININGGSNLGGPVTIDNIMSDNTLTNGIVNINGAAGLSLSIDNVSGPGTVLSGDGSIYDSGSTGATILNSGVAIQGDLPASTAVPAIGGYYDGLGIGGTSNATATPIFGVLTSTQSGNGVGNTAFTVTDSNVVATFNTTLDNGSGSMTLKDAATITGGTSTGTKIGTGTTQKFGFWNVTPVVQPQTTGTTTGFTANTGTPVLAGSTFTGNTGSAAYTVGDIVLALKQAGVMKA